MPSPSATPKFENQKPLSLVEETKLLATYVFQEGGLKDQEDLVRALDTERLLAWIERGKGNPTEIFKEALAILSLDSRDSVRSAVEGLVKLQDAFFNLAEFKEVHGMTKEAVVKWGRQVVASILERASARPLEPNEVPFVKDMAERNPDRNVIEQIFSRAEEDWHFAHELAFNEDLTHDQSSRLAALVMRKIDSDPHWRDVAMELVVRHHRHLDPAFFHWFSTHPRVKDLGEIWERPSLSATNVIPMPAKAPKAKTKEQKLADRAAKKARRKTDTVGTQGEYYDEAVNY